MVNMSSSPVFTGSPQSDVSEDLQTVTQNKSPWDNCITVMFSKMPFLPWNNPDNIISQEVETIVYRIKLNLLMLLFLIGGPANVINMAVFYKQGLGDRVNLCLFALALADGIYLTISTISHGEQLYLQFTTGERFGPIGTFLANNNVVTLVASTYVSHFLSAIIATERCLCVLNPLRFQTLLRTRTMAAIILVTSMLITSLYFIVAFRYHVGCFHDPVSGMVITTLTDGSFYRKHKPFINALHSFVFGLGLPATEIVVVTISTVITVVKLRQAVMWRSGTSSSISPKELALTKILVGNSVFFIVCITPFTLIRFVNLFFPEVNSARRHHNLFLSGVWITEIFSFINSTFNFFVYFLMGSHFRKTLWALLGRKEKEAKP